MNRRELRADRMGYALGAVKILSMEYPQKSVVILQLTVRYADAHRAMTRAKEVE